MGKLEFKERLDLVSRAGAILLVALYGAGFLVVSFRDASYGIVEFGVFRTRLLSAGIIFAIFLGIPFLEACRVFGLLGVPAFESRIGGRDEKLDSSAFSVRSMQIFVFISSSLGTAFFMRMLLADFDWSLRFVLLYLSYMAVVSAVLVARGFGRLRNSAVLSIVVLTVTVALLAFLITMRQWDYLLLLAWFALVGRLTFQMDSPIREPRKLIEANWTLTVLNIVAVFGLFAVFLYPKIRPVYGGGEPTKVVLEFATVSPIGKSAKSEVWLVDETNEGYYVIHGLNDHKAIFIPRPSVSAVYFEPSKPAL